MQSAIYEKLKAEFTLAVQEQIPQFSQIQLGIDEEDLDEEAVLFASPATKQGHFLFRLVPHKFYDGFIIELAYSDSADWPDGAEYATSPEDEPDHGIFKIRICHLWEREGSEEFWFWVSHDPRSQSLSLFDPMAMLEQQGTQKDRMEKSIRESIRKILLKGIPFLSKIEESVLAGCKAN